MRSAAGVPERKLDMSRRSSATRLRSRIVTRVSWAAFQSATMGA
jgi:hypothetical protein